MEARAVARYVRMSPLKGRRVALLVKGKNVKEAEAMLELLATKPARIIKDVLKSAVANAQNNHNMDPDRLRVKNVLIDKGPFLKRIRPRAMGRAYRIMKPTSHITVIVEEV
ncbi:50S ribosomal protein L22 [bacterium]|nr:50S ribosomal protein L22 [bacterium]